MTREQADKILDLALAARDEARKGSDDKAWLELVGHVYDMAEWRVGTPSGTEQ